MLLHAAAGCASAALQEVDCGVGAAAGASSAMLAGYLEDNPLSVNEDIPVEMQIKVRNDKEQALAGLVAGATGALLSGGDAQATQVAASVGTSVMKNNRQMHVAEAELIRLYGEAFAEEAGYCDPDGVCSEEDYARARAALSAEALRRVDDSFQSHLEHQAASDFLDRLAKSEAAFDVVQTTGMPEGQTLFSATGEDYANSALNAEYLLENRDLYSAASEALAQDPGNLIFGAFTYSLAAAADDAHMAPESVDLLKQNIADLSAEETAKLFQDAAYNDGFGDSNTAASLSATYLLMDGVMLGDAGMSAALAGTSAGIQQLGVERQEALDELTRLREKQASGADLSELESAILLDVDLTAAQMLSSGGSINRAAVTKLLALRNARKSGSDGTADRGADTSDAERNEGADRTEAAPEGTSATNRTGFDDLAQFRDELGLPPAGSATDRSTLAVVEVNGQQIYGINGHGQPVTGVNAISRTHAEIDALNQIQQRGIDVSGQNLTLYVDRTPCTACNQNGGIRSMVEQLGLNQLTVIGPDGPLIIRPR